MFRHILHFCFGTVKVTLALLFSIPRGKALYRDMVGIMNEAARNNGECRITSPRVQAGCRVLWTGLFFLSGFR